VALASGHGVCAVAQRTESFRFDAAALAAGDGTTLATTLRAARLTASREAAGRVELHVALCAPWTAPREVSLPPMRAHEAHAVLTRDHARHFPVARDQPVVASQPLRLGAWLAADADGLVLGAIARAAADAGYAAVCIVPAAVAWAVAGGAATARPFVVDDESTVISARGGRLTALRRMRAADAPTAGALSEDAVAVAARHASECTALELVGRDTRTERAAAARRLSRRLVGAGIFALVVAALAVYGGAARRLSTLEAGRAALQPTVRPVAAQYDALAALQEARTAMRTARAENPWSARLAAIAGVLPDDAHLTAFRAAGDSAVIEGEAPSAGGALARMRQAPGVRSVRELQAGPAGDESREPFAAVVHFRSGGAP
jgi:hypothetical protein